MVEKKTKYTKIYNQEDIETAIANVLKEQDHTEEEEEEEEENEKKRMIVLRLLMRFYMGLGAPININNSFWKSIAIKSMK